MAIMSFKDIRAKWRSSKDQKYGYGNAEQPYLCHGQYALPQSAAQAVWTSQPIYRKPLMNQSNVQYIAPFTPDQVGPRQPDHHQDQSHPQELPGTRGRWASESEQNMSRDEYLRQQKKEHYQSHLKEAERKSRLIAERHQKAEAERLALERQRNSSKESVRQLRELVRERYRLDLYIWSERDVLPADRELVMRDCQRADDRLRRIYTIVSCWDEEFFAKKDWDAAKKIKEGILAAKAEGGHLLWAQKPPWEYESDRESLSDDGWND